VAGFILKNEAIARQVLYHQATAWNDIEGVGWYKHHERARVHAGTRVGAVSPLLPTLTGRRAMTKDKNARVILPRAHERTGATQVELPRLGLEELPATGTFPEHQRCGFHNSQGSDPATRRQFLLLVGASLSLAEGGGCSPAPALPGRVGPSAHPPGKMAPGQLPSFATATLDALQRDGFRYFLKEINPANGLVPDRTRADEPAKEGNAPASIAAVGFALAAYPIGVERGFLTRAEAVERTLATLRFFRTSPQGAGPDATGHKGFYYHFLDMQSGRRAGQCELSTIDTTFLLAGMLAAAAYFNQDSADEREIRMLADALYRRTNWQWAQNGGATVTHGWKPESGFLKYRWEGYDEALLLYALGLGSPTYPLPAESYAA
jgi:hypothetical protein